MPKCHTLHFFFLLCLRQIRCVCPDTWLPAWLPRLPQKDFGNEIEDAVTYVEKAVQHAARQPVAGQCRVGIRGTRKYIWDVQNNNFGVCELTGGKTVPIATFFRLNDTELATRGYTGPTRYEDYFLNSFQGGHELLP